MIIIHVSVLEKIKSCHFVALLLFFAAAKLVVVLGSMDRAYHKNPKGQKAKFR